MDVWTNPVSILPKPPFKSQVGLAIASGPSVMRNIELVANLNPLDPKVTICCADRAAWSFGARIPAFYVASTEHSPLIRGFYNKMSKPIAAVLSCFASHEVVKVLLDRQIRHYYYCPAFAEDDHEFKLLNQVLQDLTGAPLMYGVSDSGSMAFRVLTGLGIKKIGLVGFDYAENADTPHEKWSMWPAIQKYMKENNVGFEETKKRLGFREGAHSVWGTKYVTDRSWDFYRERLKTLIASAQKQGIQVVNCSEGGSLDWQGLKCLGLKTFLAELGTSKATDREH